MPTPAEEREIVAAERRERIARQAAERQAAAERRAAVDWDEVQRIIDQSNREIAERQRAKAAAAAVKHRAPGALAPGARLK